MKKIYLSTSQHGHKTFLYEGISLELRAREKIGGAICALLDLAAKIAIRLNDDGTEDEVSLDQLLAGDKVRTRHLIQD